MNDIIYKLFKNSYSTFDSVKIEGYNEYHYDNVKIRMTNDTKYVASTVQEELVANVFTLHKIRYTFNHSEITLDIYYKKDKYNSLPSIKKITTILNFYVYVLNHVKYNPQINVILYLTDLKKQFPSSKDAILNENHVNSGVTFLSEEHQQIIIYRKEELFKVLLHELIHYYKLDFHYYDRGYDDYFIENYGIKVKQPPKNSSNPLALYEIYTDTIACYGYMITYCLFKNKSLVDVLEAEKTHYMKQASKVYQFSELLEDTHCFSYYIGKAAVFYHLKKFLEFVNKFGIDIGDNSGSLLEFINMCLKNQFFWNILKSQKNFNIVLSSLKMSKINI
jgi:hypothetical protein